MDRWLLRLALDEADGLRSIQREFRRRMTSPRHEDSVSEALLAQVPDLESRMRALGLTPGQILDEVERQSTWLYKKAFRRVWHATSIRRTAAMERTPCKVLESRALAGNWAAFPISPAPYFAEMRSVVGDGWYDHRATELVVTLLDLAGERLLRSARTDDEPHADLALRDLASLIAELRAAGLEYQLDKARRLRRAVVAVADELRDGPDAEGLDM
jgi:hypothetical protein